MKQLSTKIPTEFTDIFVNTTPIMTYVRSNHFIKLYVIYVLDLVLNLCFLIVQQERSVENLNTEYLYYKVLQILRNWFHSMQTNLGGKFTDIKRGFVKLLQAYKVVRKLIYKLTNRKSNHINDIEALIQGVERVHKITQRQIRQFAQLHLVTQVQSMLRSYIYKSDVKFRRYDVYSHTMCFINILHDKISEFVPKNVLICEVTAQMLKWKLFLSELDENKQSLICWLKQSSKSSFELQITQKIIPSYKISTYLSKVQTPSTAHMSLNKSVRNDNNQQSQQKRSPLKKCPYLKRCQNQKSVMKGIQNRNLSINTRSPSVIESITPPIKPRRIENSKTISIRQLQRKMTKKRPFYRQAEVEDKSCDSVQKREQKESSNQCENTKQQQMQIKDTFNSSNTIPEEPITQTMKQQLHGHHQYKDKLPQNNHTTTQYRSSIRKIRQIIAQNRVIKSSFCGQGNSKQSVDSDQQQSGFELLKGQNVKRIRTGTKFGTKFMKLHSPDADQQFQQSLISDRQFEEISNKNSGVYFQTLQLKTNSKPKNKQLSQLSQKSFSQVAFKNSTRKHGLIIIKQIAGQLQAAEAKQQDDQAERQNQLNKRSIASNLKLMGKIGGFQPEIQVQYQNLIQSPIVKKSPLNDFYKELVKMKTDQIKTAQASPSGAESMFFMRQDILRQQKSRQLQAYIATLSAKQHNIGGMFQIKSQDSNFKIQNYMYMQRKYAFEADDEWIKKNLKADNNSQVDIDYIQQSPTSYKQIGEKPF